MGDEQGWKVGAILWKRQVSLCELDEDVSDLSIGLTMCIDFWGFRSRTSRCCHLYPSCKLGIGVGEDLDESERIPFENSKETIFSASN